MLAGAPKSALTVGPVIDQDDFLGGRCEVVSAEPDFGSQRYIFISDLKGRAVMNINGRDTQLKLVRSTKSRKPPRKGDRSTYWYASEAIVVRVDYTFDGACPPDVDTCEIFGYYRATIQVTAGSLKKSIAGPGLCGY